MLIIEAGRYIGFLEQKNVFQSGVLWVRRAAEFSGVMIGTQSLFCFRATACNFQSYAAHRTPRVSAEEVGAAEDASRAAVQIESSDTMPSRKAHCQAPPDNPEIGDTYEV